MWKTTTFNVPDSFNFRLTATSHGWYDLKPFNYDAEANILRYVIVEGSKAVEAKVSPDGNKVSIELDRAVSDKSTIPEKVRHALRIDDGFADFHAMAIDDEHLKWAAESGAGRLLRSPTVFEDLVKTLCTTNCSWGLTRNMVTNLVNELGVPSKSGARAFPDAAALAERDEKFFRESIKAGYRSSYFVELAEKVASGKVNPELWLDPDMPLDELKKEIRSLKGFGEYATDNLMKLLGRYDGLALDSWLRARFYEKHNRGKKCPDKKILKRYAKFGKWQGLAIWCDMTSDWHA
jgi:3-methyladenine DNA glycosylase/8-oxoguanine DNA glycosylase